MNARILIVALLVLAVGCSNGANDASPSGGNAGQAAPSDDQSESIGGIVGQIIPPNDTPDNTPSDQPSSPPPAQASDAIVGETVKEQSFPVEFELAGESEFITTAEDVDGRPKLHFYVKKADAVTELAYEPESPGAYYSVAAVAFRDVSGDDRKDIIILMEYVTGAGQMGTVPVSQLLLYKQTESGFVQDQALQEKARAGVPYRILTIQDVMTGLATEPSDSVPNAWKKLKSGDYELEGSDELQGSTVTVEKVAADRLQFRLDAFYAADEEAAERGGVNIGNIESGEATISGEDMVFRDGEFELTISLIANNKLYVSDNGVGYFGHNVWVHGEYERKD
ncbi:hypothetical protein [Paenibacillus methanolicus]|uniref:Uncharacterized protein n=1 Tax=Paenibacillus methanolicus TaxID=582686 RepID=A0A5S5C5L5_9BACL|nr:hypothetical protein [Paenibacillus methanolicus]TYP74715.1 hypothetical protein BCM02_105259 [Paenibacillus methanolicus]